MKLKAYILEQNADETYKLQPKQHLKFMNIPLDKVNDSKQNVFIDRVQRYSTARARQNLLIIKIGNISYGVPAPNNGFRVNDKGSALYNLKEMILSKIQSQTQSHFIEFNMITCGHPVQATEDGKLELVNQLPAATAERLKVSSENMRNAIVADVEFKSGFAKAIIVTDRGGRDCALIPGQNAPSELQAFKDKASISARKLAS